MLDEPTAAIAVAGDANSILGNVLVNNYDGIVFQAGENNQVVGNAIEDSSNPYGESSYGLMFWGASNNTSYHNNFINNAAQAGEASTGSSFPVNTWDNGYPSCGNYWSDYQTRYPKAAAIGLSGIGDIPYVIDSQNNDSYPLMAPFSEAFLLNYLQEIAPPQISITSPTDQTYNSSNVLLAFSANKTINWAGYSLDGKQNVTLTANRTLASGVTVSNNLSNLMRGWHTITVFANDTFGDMSASQTVNFSVAPPSPAPTPTVPELSWLIILPLLLFMFYVAVALRDRKTKSS